MVSTLPRLYSIFVRVWNQKAIATDLERQTVSSVVESAVWMVGWVAPHHRRRQIAYSTWRLPATYMLRGRVMYQTDCKLEGNLAYMHAYMRVSEL